MEKNLTKGSVLKTVIEFSLPFLLSYFLQTLYGMADLFIIGRFYGIDSTTAVSIGSQVMHMLTVMIVGLAMGATVKIGRAVGSQRPEEAARIIGSTVTLFLSISVLLAAGLLLARMTLRYAILIAVVWGAVAILVMQAAEPFVSLFVDRTGPGRSEVIRLGGQYMRGYVWDCLFAGVNFSFSGYFCAYGLSMAPFLHNSVSIILVRLPLACLASAYFKDTLFPMGLASPSGSLLSVCICIGVFLWLRKRQTKKGR